MTRTIKTLSFTHILLLALFSCKKEGGEYLYGQGLPGSHPKYWRAPDTTGSYSLSVRMQSGDIVAADTVMVMVY